MADNVKEDPTNEKVRHVVDCLKKIAKKDDKALYEFFNKIPASVISTMDEYVSKELESENATAKDENNPKHDSKVVHYDNPIHNQSQTEYDVIIAGAGPVGLFLACELATAKCSVLVLEKAENPHSALKKVPFGMRGLSSLSVEAFYRRGLLPEFTLSQKIRENFRPPQAPQQRPQGGHFAGLPIYHDRLDPSQWKYRLPSSTDTNMFAEMEEVETVLVRRAESLGIEIKRGYAITDFHQTEDGVTVKTVNQSFRAKWLVGCDGSRSVVRKLGGFEFAGTEPEFTGYSAMIDIADPEKLKPGRNLTEAGMYWQVQPGYVVLLEFDGGAHHNNPDAVTLEHLQRVIRHVSNTDITLKAVHHATTWTDRARQATAYRNGRVFLAGDAAHIHSPLGGQGLNLGLGDAMNLGWKLAATIKGRAPEGLLDTYYAERHPIGAQILDWSRAQVAIMRPDRAARALRAIIYDLMDTRDGATYIAGRVGGVYLRYNLGSDHPLVGRTVPNFEFEDGVKIGELMHDGKGIILDFNSNPLLKSLANEHENQIKYISRHAKEQLGLSALLIRPDGFIAWASDNEPNEQSLRQAISVWFV